MRIGARYKGWNWCYECKRTIVTQAPPGRVVQCQGCLTRFKVCTSPDQKRSRYVLEARYQDD